MNFEVFQKEMQQLNCDINSSIIMNYKFCVEHFVVLMNTLVPVIQSQSETFELVAACRKRRQEELSFKTFTKSQNAIEIHNFYLHRLKYNFIFVQLLLKFTHPFHKRKFFFLFTTVFFWQNFFKSYINFYFIHYFSFFLYK